MSKLTGAALDLVLASHPALSVPCASCKGSGKSRQYSDAESLIRDLHREQSIEGEKVECSFCQGTGRIWPLREYCVVREAGYHIQNGIAHNAKGCPGWIPKKPHLEALLALMPGKAVVWFSRGDNEPEWVAQCGEQREFWAEASTSLEAAERALLAALGSTDSR